MPALIPATDPPPVMVATDTVPLVQLPPVTLSANTEVPPAHTVSLPEIADTPRCTVSVLVADDNPHALDTAYDIMDGPAATPVTTPVEPMVATDVFPLVHTPPDTESVNVVVVPLHIYKHCI